MKDSIKPGFFGKHTTCFATANSLINQIQERQPSVLIFFLIIYYKVGQYHTEAIILLISGIILPLFLYIIKCKGHQTLKMPVLNYTIHNPLIYLNEHFNWGKHDLWSTFLATPKAFA